MDCEHVYEWGERADAFKITAAVNLISDNLLSVGGLVGHFLGCHGDKTTTIEGRMLNSISLIKLIKLVLVGTSYQVLFSLWAEFAK
jgi:hypothetical protein